MAKPRYTFGIKGFYDAEKTDPQAIGEFLEDLIAEKAEYVTGEEIIAAARPHSSPMRHCFTWDDAVAADKQRKREVKNLLGTLRVEKGEKTTQAFEYVHHPAHAGKRVLMSHRSIAANQWALGEIKERGAKRLRRELQQFIHTWGGNPEMRALVKDMKKLEQKIEREFLATV